mmetsp:Transcript_41862/g.98100  ORF Transcript_41862/g.98100 Transcript_41862/m.98100 type:complete len:211 (+) Transcript_41862:29-661(+)
MCVMRRLRLCKVSLYSTIVGIKIIKIFALLCFPRQSRQGLRLDVPGLPLGIKFLQFCLLHLIGHLLCILCETDKSVFVVIEVLELGIVLLFESRVVGEVVLDVHVEFGAGDAVVAVDVGLFEFVVVALDGVHFGAGLGFVEGRAEFFGLVVGFGEVFLQFVHVAIILGVQLLPSRNQNIQKCANIQTSKNVQKIKKKKSKNQKIKKNNME